MLKNNKDIIWTLFGQLSRVVFQSGFILILAILLNPTLYGKYTIVVALITIMGPFVGIGFNQLLIELKIKNEYSSNQIYSTGIALIGVTFFLFLLLGISLITLFYGGDYELLILFLFLAISDLLILKITELNSQACIANSKFDKAAKIQSMISFSRFFAVATAVCLSLFFDTISALSWLVFYTFFSLLSLVYSFKISSEIISNFNISKIIFNKVILSRGIYYSIGLSSQGVYNDIDKIILSKNPSVIISQIGNYGLAYKLMDVIFVPLKAVLIKNFPLIIEKGRKKDWQFLRRYLKKIITFSYLYIFLVLTVTYLIGESLINFFFLDQYDETYSYLIYIAPLLFIRITNYLIADIITGLGYQKHRSIIQVSVAVVNLLLSLLLINKLNVIGAILASYLSESIMLALFWLFIKKIKKKVEHEEIS